MVEIAQVCQLRPNKEWLEDENENDDTCRPCAIAVLVSEYQNVLAKNDREDLSKEIATALDKFGDNDDPITGVAQLLDDIKGKVDKPLRRKLEKKDRKAQCG